MFYVFSDGLCITATTNTHVTIDMSSVWSHINPIANEHNALANFSWFPSL